MSHTTLWRNRDYDLDLTPALLHEEALGARRGRERVAVVDAATGGSLDLRRARRPRPSASPAACAPRGARRGDVLSLVASNGTDFPVALHGALARRPDAGAGQPAAHGARARRLPAPGRRALRGRRRGAMPAAARRGGRGRRGGARARLAAGRRATRARGRRPRRDRAAAELERHHRAAQERHPHARRRGGDAARLAAVPLTRIWARRRRRPGSSRWRTSSAR